MEKEKTKVQKKVDLLLKKNTKENLKKLIKIEKTAKDEYDRDYARLMRENADFFYYYPQNEKEFSELLLVWKTRRKESWIIDREMKAKAAVYELEEYSFDKKIHSRILKKQTKKKKEDWQYCYMDDFSFRTQNRLEELESDIEYEKAWVKEAKNLIKTKRYKELPADYFVNNIFDFQTGSAWEDDDKERCCNCCCGE